MTEKNPSQRWMFKIISCEENVKYRSSIFFLECILHCNTLSSHPGCLVSQPVSMLFAFTPQKWKRKFMAVLTVTPLTSELSRMTFVPDVRWARDQTFRPAASWNSHRFQIEVFTSVGRYPPQPPLWLRHHMCVTLFSKGVKPPTFFKAK